MTGIIQIQIEPEAICKAIFSLPIPPNALITVKIYATAAMRTGNKVRHIAAQANMLTLGNERGGKSTPGIPKILHDRFPELLVFMLNDEPSKPAIFLADSDRCLLCILKEVYRCFYSLSVKREPSASLPEL
jgi:hypothetical protein